SRTAGPTRGADDVTQVEVDLLVADQLDATRAVDEVEERELPHLAPSHDAPGDSVLQLERLPRLGLLGLGPNRSDLLPVRKPLRQHRASLGNRRKSGALRAP